MCFNSIIANIIGSKDEAINCIADYLKSINELESSFQTNPYEGSAATCDYVIKSTNASFYEMWTEELEKIPQFKTDLECIMGNLKKTQMSLFLLKELVYEASTSLSDEEKSLKINEAKKAQEKNSLIVSLHCIATRRYGDLFDRMMTYTSSEEDNYDPKEEYCIRRHVNDNNILNNEIYKYTLNPGNVNVDQIDCDPIMEMFSKVADNKMTNIFEEEIASLLEKECYNTKFDVNQSTNRMLAIMVLRKLKLSEVSDERQKFIDNLLAITKAITTNCRDV